jgi:hypothetical protein
MLFYDLVVFLISLYILQLSYRYLFDYDRDGVVGIKEKEMLCFVGIEVWRQSMSYF